MKVIMINKRRLGVTIIIIGLMIILFGFQNRFDAVIKQTALIQSNISPLREYSALNGKLTYKLPKDWTITERKFEGNEILYHADFQSGDAKIYGFVQVWNINEDLKDFLIQSKKNSDLQNTYKKYVMNPVTIKGNSGYILDYTILNKKNIPYSGYEYFFKDGNNKILRFSFFTKESNFKENMPTIYKTIVETLNYKQ